MQLRAHIPSNTIRIVFEFVVIDAIINIGAGRLKNVDKKIDELESIRSSIVESANDARDYLNWFEATRIDKRSNNFTDYQQIYNELMRPLPSRKDELSEYLDELDEEFKK